MRLWLERLVIIVFVCVAFVAACTTLVRAADLPTPKALHKIAAPVASPYSGFSIGAFAGLGLSPTENELTFAGTAMGPQKAWPTGGLFGLVLGYHATMNQLMYGVEIRGAYDFSRGGADCSDVNAAVFGVSCLASRKNSWLLQEVFEGGLTLASFNGAIPANAQPGNWPVPITVPANFATNFAVLPRVGFAQRNVDLCAVVDMAGTSACASKFINAWSAGAKLSLMASGSSEIAATWDHVFWGQGSTFTPLAASPLFQNSVAIKQEDIFTLGYNYHLCVGC